MITLLMMMGLILQLEVTSQQQRRHTLFSLFQRHLARTAGRWKDSSRKNTLSELQDELMSVRLREAEAQAELRETRQRMLEMETQVRLPLCRVQVSQVIFREQKETMSHADLQRAAVVFAENFTAAIFICFG